MLRLIISVFIALIVMSGNSAFATDQYVEANVARVEICTSSQYILLFLSDTTGTLPTIANGCSNNGNYPIVKISDSLEEFDSKNGMLSMALVAYSAGKRVRIRFDDATNKVNSIALLE